MMRKFVLGLDFGTGSVRALIVDPADGNCIAEAVVDYPRWKQGRYCNAAEKRFRQHPYDYLESLENVIKQVVPDCPGEIVALALDTTASTPCLVDRNFTPLCLTEEFKDDPDAMFVMWKDHTSTVEAKEITELNAKSAINYCRNTGGDYSTENFWSKFLHIFRTHPRIADAAWAAVECCDWIPAQLTGKRRLDEIKAGHCVCDLKHMHDMRWGGYPSKEFLDKLDPHFSTFASHLPQEHYLCDTVAGNLTQEWADKLGLKAGIPVGVGNIDSYSGAVGGGVAYGRVVLNLGTSSCYMAVAPKEVFGDKLIDGIFGQVDDSILPGYVGFEAGLSAFGDCFAWFNGLMHWPLDTFAEEIGEEKVKALKKRLFAALYDAAAAVPLTDDLPMATDYLNGRRNPWPDAFKTGTINGLRLSTSTPELFRAYIEAVVFASKAVIDHYRAGGIKIDSLMGIGGISLRSPFVMQMLSDVFNMDLEASNDTNSCAIGSAIHAAVIAGIYPTVEEAQDKMALKVTKIYHPTTDQRDIIGRRYARYCEMGGIPNE